MQDTTMASVGKALLIYFVAVGVLLLGGWILYFTTNSFGLMFSAFFLILWGTASVCGATMLTWTYALYRRKIYDRLTFCQYVAISVFGVLPSLLGFIYILEVFV